VLGKLELEGRNPGLQFGVELDAGFFPFVANILKT
jgi:hypothetical protein